MGHPLQKRYALATPVRPMGTEPVPAAFEESQGLHERARAAYVAHDYARSADLFVRAALVLRVPAGMYAGTAAYNRTLLFENAAYAWLTAETPEVGREALDRLRKGGLATADELRRAYAVLR